MKFRDILKRRFVDVVKITRRVGEDEILEISFNGRNQETITKARAWLDFLYDRMLDHNKRVLDATATIGGVKDEAIVKRVK